jgi:hypothetical protein
MVTTIDENEVPSTPTDVFLLNTMRGLETGLTVGTIASSPIETCTLASEVDDVLSRPEWSDYDVLPVEADQGIVAVVERKSRSRRSFHSGMLASWDQPLEEFLATPRFIDDGFRLVVYKAQIAGIVTPSDLLRLPVRVLAFALLSHLEHAMNTVIGECGLEPVTWLAHLSQPRRMALQRYQDALRKKRMNPDLLEFTYFSDKILILRGLNMLEEDEIKAAWDLNELRNQVAHNRNYVRSQDELKQFVKRLQSIRMFITRLETLAEVARKGLGETRRVNDIGGDPHEGEIG